MGQQEQDIDKITLPEQGFIFWPVGTGDSSTIAITKGVVMQLDLHHLESSDAEDDPRIPIIDRLVNLLPKRNNRPYLALFALTHPDQDHCRGFAELLKRVAIGELWFTPRIFREYKKDLCDDAIAFRTEAERRVRKTIKENGKAESGDRIRIIGYDELLQEEAFKGFPKDRLTIPGNTVALIDGTDYYAQFVAYVHGPFKDDADGDRNDASLALQITLKNGDILARGMFLGDLCYPTIKRIFTVSKAVDLAWNIFLAPHHCSKSVMYWQGEDETEATLKQDILDAIENAGKTIGYVVSSSDVIPAKDEPGDNPPHAKAAQRYREIAPTGFLCTQEHPDNEQPRPIIFTHTSNGLTYTAPEAKKAAAAAVTITEATTAARGTAAPPKDSVGFGKK